MKRLLLLVVLGGAALVLSPTEASAQFRRPFGGPFGSPLGPLAPLPTLPHLSPLPSLPSLRPLPALPHLPSLPPLRTLGPVPNPYRLIPQSGFSVSVSASPGSFTGPIIGYNPGNSVGDPIAVIGAVAAPYGYYGQGGSYMTYSASPQHDFMLAAQRNLEKAQRQVSTRDEIAGQWNYERGTAPAPLPELGPLPDPIRIALAPTDPSKVTSGEVLNTLVGEAARAEAKVPKGTKPPSAYLPPLLLEDIRFSHSPAGDLLNLTRQAGNLDFPAAFDDPALAQLRAHLEKDFATVAVSVQAGKSPDPDKLTKLEVTFQKVQDTAAPVIKNLPFEDAIAVRRFLNQMANAIKALKSGTATGLIDPKWTAEGLTVSDLVKHMTKHKLQFGAAPRGGEEAYATMHRNLATYLFVLNQNPPKQ